MRRNRRKNHRGVLTPKQELKALIFGTTGDLSDFHVSLLVAVIAIYVGGISWLVYMFY